MIRTVAIVSSILAMASAECPNGCSAHGRCTAYDMCLCYRNWMSNDCSERVCQFGLAHVDTPKGDLDASSGALDGTDVTVALNSEMYPYGTTEQFPAMMADGEYLENTAHYYMECSNKGMCDRESGTCECFPGYEGSACQRASCPSTGGQTCSGHGTCETIKQIAAADYGNIYELWDEKATMGCVCDPGYYGADCALRECKYGADPLYFDDNANIRYSNWTVVIAAHTDETAIEGTYSITFYDHHGEDWETGPLAADADCAAIITALEDIPNDVVPDDSVRCYKFDTNEDPYAYWALETNMEVFHRYTLLFPENPGYLKEIRLNKYLDGDRPTLTTAGTDNDLQMFVFADGFHGEDNDMVPDECEDVQVGFRRSAGQPTVGNLTDYFYLSFPDPDVMVPLLKRCLGDADNDESFSGTADEVYDWDYGSEQNPHLVKFIEDTDGIVSRHCHSVNDFARVDATHNEGWCYEEAPAGFYAPVIFGQGEILGDAFDNEFIVYSNAPLDYDYDTLFRVFTTTGYLNRVNAWAEVFTKTTSFTDMHSNVLYTYNRGQADNFAIHGGSLSDYQTVEAWPGNVDCETYTVDDITTEDCLQKGDRVMFFTTETTDENYFQTNPRYHNMYTVQKIYKEYPLQDTPNDDEEEMYRNRIVLDMHVNFRSVFTASSTATAKADDQRLRAYKFYPPATVVNYVDECSGRGLCDTDSGLCQCFVGYTKDDCSIQSGGAS